MENLAEAQREAVRALAALTDELRRRPEGTPAAAAGALEKGQEAGGIGRTVLPRGSSELERVWETTSRVVRDSSEATAANTGALAGLSRQLGALPSLAAGLFGERKEGGFSGVLKSGLGLVPLGLKLAGLFGGKRQEEPVRFTTYSEPDSLALEAGNTENILAGFPRIERGQRGEARAIERERGVVWQPQVTVNVSAMDSRSFLDHSGEIARAVREAMLHMHPVNDLISEL